MQTKYSREDIYNISMNTGNIFMMAPYHFPRQLSPSICFTPEFRHINNFPVVDDCIIWLDTKYNTIDIDMDTDTDIDID